MPSSLLLIVYLTFSTPIAVAAPSLLAASAADYEVAFAQEAPVIDGQADDEAWKLADWRPIDQLILGSMPTAEDFSGRFKVVWTEKHLYLLAEITDDVLIDKYAHPLSHYWDDDCLEIFIDENQSGGDHLNNYNAFAYHIALDNQVVDIGTDGEPRTLNDHIESLWKRDPNRSGKLIWELAIRVYEDRFTDHYHTDVPAEPVTLTADKQMGLMIAYCDADGANGREHFMSSSDIEPVDGSKNRGYIDASVFEVIRLVE